MVSQPPLSRHAALSIYPLMKPLCFMFPAVVSTAPATTGHITNAVVQKDQRGRNAVACLNRGTTHLLLLDVHHNHANLSMWQKKCFTLALCPRSSEGATLTASLLLSPGWSCCPGCRLHCPTPLSPERSLHAGGDAAALLPKNNIIKDPYKVLLLLLLQFFPRVTAHGACNQL